MKRSLALFLLLFSAASLHAQTTATIFSSSQHNEGGTFPSATRTLATKFDDGSGFGASIARSFGRFSAEVALFRLSSRASIQENGVDVFSLGNIQLTPVTAMLRYHAFRGRPFGIYAGAGAAYVMTRDIDSVDTRAEGLQPIPVDNELAAVFGGGITYDFSPRLGVALDARYLPLTLTGRPEADDDERIDATLDPLVVSAGLRFRF